MRPYVPLQKHIAISSSQMPARTRFTPSRSAVHNPAQNHQDILPGSLLRNPPGCLPSDDQQSEASTGGKLVR